MHKIETQKRKSDKVMDATGRIHGVKMKNWLG